MASSGSRPTASRSPGRACSRTGAGALNPRGVAFYRRLVEGLLERGIEPIATLYHWDLPQARQEAGGWAVRDTARALRRVRGARWPPRSATSSQGWITHNEPWVVAFLGHAEGRKAPGIRDWPTALAVAHHLLLSHGLAVDALRARRQAPVGITLNLNPMRPSATGGRRRRGADGRPPEPLVPGPGAARAYPADMLEHYERTFGPLPQLNPEDLDVISRPIDFLGVNYYFPTTVRDRSEAPLQARERRRRAGRDGDGLGGRRHGLHDLLLRLRADYGDLEICITENGAAFDDETLVDGVVEDPSRVAYLSDHLEALRRAVATASTSGATTRGRCSTTSSGSTATTSASASCAWTTPRRSASRSAARSGTAITSRDAGRGA